MADLDPKVLIPTCLACGGVLLIAMGGFWHWCRRRRFARWTRIHGIVEDYEQVELEAGPSYNPRIVFLDSVEQKHRFKADALWGRGRPEIGEPIAIIYHPERPDYAYLDDNIDPYQGPILFYIMGGFLLSGSFGFFVFFNH